MIKHDVSISTNLRQIIQLLTDFGMYTLIFTIKIVCRMRSMMLESSLSLSPKKAGLESWWSVLTFIMLHCSRCFLLKKRSCLRDFIFVLMIPSIRATAPRSLQKYRFRMHQKNKIYKVKKSKRDISLKLYD